MKFAIFTIILIHSSLARYEALQQLPATLDLRSKALADIIEEFFTRQSIIFDIIVFGDVDGTSIGPLVDALGKRNPGKYSSVVRHVQSLYDWNRQLDKSALVLMADAKHLQYFNQRAQLANEFPKPMKFLIFIDNPLNLMRHMKVVGFMHNRPGFVDEREFVIFEDKVGVELLTFEWYTSEECDHAYVLTVNSMRARTRQWKRPLKNFENFRNFHRCPVVAGAHVNTPSSFHVDNITGQPRGLMVDLHETLAQVSNFQPKLLKYATKGSHRHFPTLQKSHLSPEEQLQVIHEVKTTMIGPFHTTATFHQNRFIFAITPGEPYSIYEKMLLVYDGATWSLLLATFGVAFTAVAVVIKLPRWAHNAVFGEGVRTPTMNILHIFFGLGQMKVPRASFPRFLLINFIFFCLIFRTTYQSILFEFMTSDMRKPAPRTIDHLFERNFTIVSLGFGWRHMADHLDAMLSQQRRPAFHLLHTPEEFEEFYLGHKDNYTAKFAFFMPEDSLVRLKHKCKCSPLVLDQHLFTIQNGIAMYRNHFLFELTQDVLQKFIPMGIVQHLYDFHMWLHYRQDIEPEDLSPQVLTLDDLGFGFVIWLIACAIAALGYFWEIFLFKMRRPVRTGSGLLVFLVLLWERMQHYRG